jgi:hypothetical protein
MHPADVPAGVPDHSCAVTRSQLRCQGRRALYSRHDRRGWGSTTAIRKTLSAAEECAC